MWQNGKDKERKAPQKKWHLSKTLRERGKDSPRGRERTPTKMGKMGGAHGAHQESGFDQNVINITG